MADYTVTGWADLIDKLYQFPRDGKHRRYRSNFVYRGMADQAWRLDTTLKRLGGQYATLEKPIIRNFNKYAEPGSIFPGNFWANLSIAQHHGLPTRLMDWTVSPKVALHFATSELEHYDKDGIIVCVNIARAQDFLPLDFQAVLDRESASLFSIEMLNDLVPDLDSLDSYRRKRDFTVFFEPPSLDARIVNQGAVVSVMPGAGLDLDDLLSGPDSHGPDWHDNLCNRLIIPKALKWEVRDKLDQDNVTERMLFPGLDGLSAWLKRYYSPVP